jgi:hypothetical protein
VFIDGAGPSVTSTGGMIIGTTETSLCKPNIADLANLLTNYDKSMSAAAMAISPVPEPGTMALLAAGVAGLLACMRRHHRQSRRSR